MPQEKPASRARVHEVDLEPIPEEPCFSLQGLL